MFTKVYIMLESKIKCLKLLKTLTPYIPDFQYIEYHSNDYSKEILANYFNQTKTPIGTRV